MRRHIFPGPVQGFAKNQALRHLWRFKGQYDVDDLMQEAYLVFMRCCQKMENGNSRQFMAFYSRALLNHFHDLALISSQADAFSRAHDTDDGPGLEVAGELDNDGMLSIMISQAPAEIRAVLSLLLNAPAELLEIALASWNGEDKRKKSRGSEAINRALGLPLQQDTLGKVRSYFAE